MKHSTLYSQIESLPENLKNEVKNFVEFLLTKVHKNSGSPKNQRTPGVMKGKIILSSDFDKPLDDFKEYME